MVRQALVWSVFGEARSIQLLVHREGRALHTPPATEGWYLRHVRIRRLILIQMRNVMKSKFTPWPLS